MTEKLFCFVAEKAFVDIRGLCVLIENGLPFWRKKIFCVCHFCKNRKGAVCFDFL